MRLSTLLRGDESSTCVCLRIQEQCMHSKISSVARVTHVLLLRSVVGYRVFNTLASKRSELMRKRSDCSKAPRNPQKVDLCVLQLASSSCRVYMEAQERKFRPVSGLTGYVLIREIAYLALLILWGPGLAYSGLDTIRPGYNDSH